MPDSLAYEVHRSQHFLRKLQQLARCNRQANGRILRDDGISTDAHDFWEALEEIEGHLSRMAYIANAIGGNKGGES